jgi:hypothetical protein
VKKLNTKIEYLNQIIDFEINVIKSGDQNKYIKKNNENMNIFPIINNLINKRLRSNTMPFIGNLIKSNIKSTYWFREKTF